MAGETNGKTPPPSMSGEPLETVTVGALQPGEDPALALVATHLKSATAHLRDGAPQKGFAELIRASRTVLMTPRLASAVVRFGIPAGAYGAAVALLRQGIEENEGAARAAVRRQLSRLLRKSGEIETAREELAVLLAEAPLDRPGRGALNGLLFHEGRWEELDASLEKEGKDALKRGKLARAGRAAFLRGRLQSERLSNHGGAGQRFSQAASLFEQAGQLERALDLRLLWVRAVRDGAGPIDALKEAADATLALAERCGALARTKGLLRDLIPANPGQSMQPSTSRRMTRTGLLAAGDEAAKQGRSSEAAALYNAAVQEEPDEATERRLEAHHVARGAWRDLAQLYRDRSQRAKTPVDKADALGKLAELLEDELKDVSGAADAYAEIVRLTGDQKALAEQVRLLGQKEDRSAVRRAVDAAVQAAPDEKAKVLALTARGELAMARGKLEDARRDFDDALLTQPGHLPALAGRAELAARTGDSAPAVALRDALAALPRRRIGRKELLRRLARMAGGKLKDAELSRWAWGEITSEDPLDEEANEKVAALAKASGDHASLIVSLRAQLQKAPRGPDARVAWRDLVAALEATRKPEDALAELRQSVRMEPGHKEAWLLLFDRLAQRGEVEEAAWCLEQAATSTEDALERADTWERLATFSLEKLGDATEAKLQRTRANNIREGLRQSELETASGVVLPNANANAKSEVGTDPDRTGVSSAAERAAQAEGPTARGPAPRPGSGKSNSVGEARTGVGHPVTSEVLGAGRPPVAKLGDGPPVASGRHAAARLEDGPPVASGRHAAARLGDAPPVASGRHAAAKLGDGPPVPSGRHAAAKLGDGPPVPSGRHAAVEIPRVSSGRPAAQPRGEGPQGGDGSSSAAPEEKLLPRGKGREPTGPLPASVLASARGLKQAPTLAAERSAEKTDAGSAPVEWVEERTAIAPAGPAEVARGPLPRRPGEDLPTAMPMPAAPEFKPKRRPPPAASFERSETIEEMPAFALPDPDAGDGSVDEERDVPRDDADFDEDAESAPRIADDFVGELSDATNDESSFPSGDPEDGSLGPADHFGVSPDFDDPDYDARAAEEAALDQAEEVSEDDVLEIITGDVVILPASPDDRSVRPRQTQEVERPAEAAVSAKPTKKGKDKERLFARVRKDPLDSDGYRELSDFFDHARDTDRATLMAEIAEAIDGDPHAAPRAPRLILSATDREGLRHPVLRESEGELLALAGTALVRMYPARGKEQGSKDEFRVDAGKGTSLAAEALLTAVRLLGLRAPDLFLSEDSGPPFSLVHAKEPRLLIGRLTLKKELPEAELRFFAGRALFQQNPDLFALRSLSLEQLERGLKVVAAVVRGSRGVSAEARVAREFLPEKSMDRMKQIIAAHKKELPLQMLAMGARHSVNRAGLVVSGGVGPVLTALRTKKAPTAEVTELVRFAASERYLQLRSRRLR